MREWRAFFFFFQIRASRVDGDGVQGMASHVWKNGSEMESKSKWETKRRWIISRAFKNSFLKRGRRSTGSPRNKNLRWETLHLFWLGCVGALITWIWRYYSKSLLRGVNEWRMEAGKYQ